VIVTGGNASPAELASVLGTSQVTAA
jgi:hypothetical protein